MVDSVVKMNSQRLANNFPGPGTYCINSTISIKEKGKSFGKELRESHFGKFQ